MDLISIKGRELNITDSDKWSSIINNLNSNSDELVMLSLLQEGITHEDNHFVEYVSENETLSQEAMNSLINSAIQNDDSNAVQYYQNFALSGKIVQSSGGGWTIKDGSSSYSLLLKENKDNKWLSAHEVLGHGIAISRCLTRVENDTHGIQVENVARRMLGLEQTSGAGHNNAEFIKNPYDLPYLQCDFR